MQSHFMVSILRTILLITLQLEGSVECRIFLLVSHLKLNHFTSLLVCANSCNSFLVCFQGQIQHYHYSHLATKMQDQISMTLVMSKSYTLAEDTSASIHLWVILTFIQTVALDNRDVDLTIEVYVYSLKNTCASKLSEWSFKRTID